MSPERYLQERLQWNGETVTGFARRAGLTPQTMHDLLRKRRKGGTRAGCCWLETAWAIVKASEQQPTRYGGTIGYEDLLHPPEPASAAP